MGKFFGWLAGILATVIGGYLLWYFTTPHETTIEGLVFTDGAPVAGALVEVQLVGNAGANGAVHDFTNNYGTYRIDALPRGAGATVSVKLVGYQVPDPKSLPLSQADIRVDFPVARQPVVSPGGQPGVAPRLPPWALESMRAPVFVRKDATQAARFKLTQKP